MKGLDADKSWELFLRKTFIHESDGECPEELEPIGKKMMKKCHGLPLAISVVGGLLVETRTKSGWEEVLNQINSHLGRAASSTVSAILELSYQNLSPYLKSCFLCLAFFKEDIIIPVKRLVHIWMGQGLIQQQEVGSSVGEIAKGYLDELMNRNMVQINDWKIDGRVKNCRLHDLVREVCLRKAKEEIGLEIVKAEGESSSESGFRPRHCVVYGTFSLNQNEHIRSLFLVNVKPGFGGCASTKSSYWKKFHLIKTVDLDGFGFPRFPQCFRALLGLKYLRIGGNDLTLQLILPTWLDHLEQLEVLDFARAVILPNRTLKMDRLRYFCAYSIQGSMRIESWRNIETLKYITQEVWMRCNNSCGARELGILLELQRGVDELSRVRDSLEKMENLVSLHLDWYRFSNSTLTLIPIPNLTNLTQLKLRGMMTKCPDATTFPPNLCRLTLNLTFLVEDPMPQLGKLEVQ